MMKVLIYVWPEWRASKRRNDGIISEIKDRHVDYAFISNIATLVIYVTWS